MAVLRGASILVVSVVLLVVETYYLIIEPLRTGVEFQVTSNQYWALVFPVFVIVAMIAITSAWLGYTILTTPEPIRLDYEEAYEIAEVQTDVSDKQL